MKKSMSDHGLSLPLVLAGAFFAPILALRNGFSAVRTFSFHFNSRDGQKREASIQHQDFSLDYFHFCVFSTAWS